MIVHLTIERDELRRQLEEAQRSPSAPLDVALSFVEDALTGKEPAGERGNGLAGLADVRRHVADLRRQLAEVQAEYRALWDAACVFANTPGQVSQSGDEDDAYAALVRCVIAGGDVNDDRRS